MPLTIAEVVGSNVRAARVERGFTLADVSRAAQSHGIKWSTGRVAHIENGDRELSVQTLLLLALVLSRLFEEGVTPLQLLTTDDDVNIGLDYEVTGEGLGLLVTGQETEVQLGMIPHGREILADAAEAVSERARGIAEISGRAISVGELGRLVEAFELADERAVKKLGITEGEYLGWCRKLWGHVMSMEVAERAPADATPQKKGRITRELLAELRTAMEAEHGHDS